MTYAQFSPNYPIWSPWRSIAWENPFFHLNKRYSCLLWWLRGDRKQILIMLWTHQGKKNYLWVTAKSQFCKTVKHGGSLCSFPVPRNAARLMTRGGVGEVNDITSGAHIWILTQWHLVFLFTPPTSPPSPLWSLDCARLCLFFPPSKNTSFSLPPLKQLPAYEVEKMTLHLMMNGTWPLEPVPVGLTWRCHLHKPGDLTNELVCIREKQATWTLATAKVLQMKIKYLLINLGCKLDNLYRCFSSPSSCFLVWHTSALMGLPHWELFCYMINYSEQHLWRD